MRNILNGYPPDCKKKTGIKNKVLVIENDRGAARLAEYTLCMAGYEVLIAYDGSEGIKKVISEKPDLIILDVVTPAIDGYEICGHLWDRSETASIPVLVITSKTPERGCIIRERIGIDNYMVKPVEPVEMLNKVASLLYSSNTKIYAANQKSNSKKISVLQSAHV